MCGATPRQPDTIRHRGRDMPKRDTPTVAVIFPEIVTRRRAAKMLAVSTSLLKTWNRKKIGPPCIKRGANKETGRAVYRLDLLQAWIEAGCPMEPWGDAPPTNTKPAPVAARQITPRVKAGKPPAKKRPPIDANRSRVKEPKPPREGGNDGTAYPRPPGRQRQRSRAGGVGGKTAERAQIPNTKTRVEAPLLRPPKVEARPPRARGLTAAGHR